MTTDDLNNIQPIPGFDCVKMKHDIQAKIYEETKDMTWDERMAYMRQKAAAFRQERAQKKTLAGDLVLREEPPPCGTNQP